MRIPAKIGTFYTVSGFSKRSFSRILDDNVEKALSLTVKPGILLSGGVDSALLAITAMKYQPGIPCFVVGHDDTNPDVQAAIRLTREKGLNLHTRLFTLKEIHEIQQELRTCFPSASFYEGDECVFAALKFAVQNGITGIIATDGIDELTGGYWGHRDRKRFPDVKDAFKYYWDKLESNHLSPIHRSAKFYNLDVIFVYMFPGIVECLSEISLEDRIRGNVGKAVWKEIAELAGVPSWVVKRKKQGFLDAFNK